MKQRQVLKMAVFLLIIVSFSLVLCYLVFDERQPQSLLTDEKENSSLKTTSNLQDTYSMRDTGEIATAFFTNHVDGYSITIKDSYTVDMSRSDVYTLLSNETTRIEIYRQYAPDQNFKDSYLNYSNGFLENKTDHKDSVIKSRRYENKLVQITAWERDKNSGVNIDYNYYVSVDIVMEKEIFSFFIKSTEPIAESEYEALISSFKTSPVLVKYEPPKTNAVDLSKRNWNEETQAFYEKYLLDSTELTWGIFEPQFATFDFSNYQALEERLDYAFPVMVWYNHIAKEPDVDYWNSLLNESYQRGKILELTLQTTPVDAGKNNMVYGVLDGQYDAYLTAYAKTISDFDHPVLFRLGNEMNGDWCAYSGYQTAKDSLIFKEFYRYIYHIFEKEQADNVIWVWNPNGESKPEFTWNHALTYYPGDEYVDVVGLTAYNTGNYYDEVGEHWQTFKELYQGFYNDYDQWFHQPFMITEFACANAGGDKAAWIEEMFHEIKNYTDIKMAVWWDSCDYDADGNVARSYVIDESEEVLDTFYQGLHGK